MTHRKDDMGELDFRAIQKRCEAATKGPWTSWIEGRDHTSGSDFIMRGPPDERLDDLELTGATVEDQDFIAHARQDIPRLLAEVARLRSLLARE